MFSCSNCKKKGVSKWKICRLYYTTKGYYIPGGRLGKVRKCRYCKYTWQKWASTG